MRTRLYSEGELRGAAEAVAAARMRLDHAATDGLVRAAAVVLVTVVLLFVAFRLVRRRRTRSGNDYTAAP